MKATELSSVLRAMADLLGASVEKRGLELLANAFECHRATTVSTITRRFARQIEVAATPGLHERDISSSEVAAILQRGERLLVVAGAKSAASDFKAVIELLEQRGSDEFTSWVASLRALAAGLPRGSTTRSRSAKTAAPAADTVENYVGRFRALGFDRPSFENLIEVLRKDKNAKVKDIREIAAHITEVRDPRATREAALESIKRDFVARLRTRNELEHVSKTKPW
jgi:hypothetical protein